MSGKTLEIDEGSEFKIKVEELKNFDKSFFKDIYNSAAVSVKEIVDNTREYYIQKNSKEFFKDKEEFNNIIAFSGERGTGKTSVMTSFSEALKCVNSVTYKNDLGRDGFQQINKLEKISFTHLDVIDPALLEDNESIFEIVIAKMFSKFREKLNYSDDRLEFDDKKRLLKKFQDVYSNLRVINTDRKEFFKEAPYSEDIIQTLVGLASGSNMRSSFIELVDEFLGFFRKSEEKSNRFVVISIDDLDMDIKHSAQMAEQIRKYLMVPNVIILMAIKIDQLKDSIEQMYIENYKTMIGRESFNDNTKEMAERYIEKLIPNGRKLYLPEIRTHKNGREEKIKLIFKDKNKDSQEYSKKNTSDLSIEDTVLKMTYKKTGLIFINNEYQIHYLVPDNLRELQNYLIMFSKMKDIEDTDKSEIREKNIEKFETYFLKTWIKKNIEFEFINMIYEFNNKNIKEKNKYIVNAITDNVFVKHFKDGFKFVNREDCVNNILNDDKSIIELIIDRGNNSLNISFADVITVINLYNKYLNDEKYKKLIFAIKTLYSISFYKILKVNRNFYDAKILLGGDVIQISNMVGSKWLNLNIYNYKYLKVTDNNITIKKFIDKFIDNISENDLYENHENKSIDDTLKSDIDIKKEKNLYNKFEFVHYFLYFYDDEKKSYRKDSSIYYELDTQLGLSESMGMKKAKFNTLAFVINSLDPKNVIEKIFNRYTVFNDDENIRENSIFKEIVEMSLCKEIIEWRNKYLSVLPIYSVELLEKIIEDTRYYVNKKFKQKSNLSNFFRVFFNKSMTQAIEENYYIVNKVYNLEENDNFEIAFKSNPIIKLINLLNNNDKVNIDKEKSFDIGNILCNVESFQKAYENIEKSLVEISNNIEYLNNRIKYFSGSKIKTYSSDTIKYNAGRIEKEEKIGRVEVNPVFDELFKEKIRQWINEVEENIEPNTELGKIYVKGNHINKLLEILNSEKVRLKNLEKELKK